MRRIYFLLLLLLASSGYAVAQTTYTWAGTAVGDYQLSTNWSPARTTPAATDILAFNASSPITIANVPTQTIGAVRILSGTSTVTFTTNVVNSVLSLSAGTPLVYTTAGSIYAGDLLTISLSNAAAAFSISSGTFGIAPSTGGRITISGSLTLAGGTLDFDVPGTGGTTINSGGSITYSSGTFNSANAGAITWANGSNYYHAATGAAASAIPVSVWSGGSTCTITGLNGGNIAPTGFTLSSFANLTWNCPAQAGNIDLDFTGNPVTIAGTLTITSTGAGTNALRITGSSNSVINTGAYTQTGGIFVLQASNAGTTLTVKGVFSHTTAGTINFVANPGAGSATLNLQGNVTKGSGSTIWSSSSTNAAAAMNVQFSGISSQVVTIAGGWSVSGGRCNIINSNADPSGVSVTGTLKVVNVNSTTAATCTSSGNFTGTGTIAYSGGGSGSLALIYNGGSPQTVSSVEFPVSGGPVNLTINSGTSVNFPSSFSRTVTGTLSMISGAIALTDTLYLTNASLAAQLSYTSGFITSGTLSRRFPVTGLPTNATTTNSRYPFGTGNNNRFVNVFFSAASLTGGTGGDIAISHTAVVNATPINPLFTDNGSLLDKRTNSSWKISTGSFDLGSGGTTISVTAQGNNIGSVDNVTSLRFTDGIAGFGTLIPTTGTVDAPLVGKSNLTLADINGKTFYIGSDNQNALQIVTFTWTGAANTAWTNAANWTGGVGYPAAPTEIAIINTASGNMPAITGNTAVSVYQLTVGSGSSLTMDGTSSIMVYDIVSFDGTANFSGASTFTYASSVIPQSIANLAYVNLGVAGSASKTLPPVTTVTGDFTITGATPVFGTGTFVYAAGTAAIQRVAAANYYNLTFTGNRGGRTIRLGNGVSNNVIDVANVFAMSATNYTANIDAYNTFNFSSAAEVTIPGFTYGSITNVSTGSGKRIFDPMGSADPAHVINCKALSPHSPYVAADNTVTGSKIVLNRTLTTGNTTLSGFAYYDFELAGNISNNIVSVASGNTISIAGTFTVSATNFRFTNTTHTFNFNGTGNQSIPAFKTNAATNTPAWKFNNLVISNGNRVITLGGSNTDTIFITGNFSVPSVASFATAGTGFNAAGSTVDFSIGSASIPVLKPASGSNNYNNITVESGTHQLLGDLTLAGNLNVTGSDAAYAQVTIGNNTTNRTLSILGDLKVNGTSATSALTSIIDFNAYAYTIRINLTGNLDISGSGEITTLLGTNCGSILFNGTAQQYSNTSSNRNGYVNFIVGNGTAVTTLTLNSRLELIRSGTAPYSSSFTVAGNSILNAGTKNISVGTDDGNTGNDASFNLNSNATLITANTGLAPNTAIEGAATDGTTGTILAGTKIIKTYNTTANYVLNGATVNPFPAAITNMANLTIGAAVSLNKSIVASATLDLASYTLKQAANDLQFSGLASTTGNIYADKNSILTISGTVGTVGTLRFATGGNTTGQFTINRPVTITLASDLTIEKTPRTGNFITGTASSILDINGNTLTINGSVSGPGTLSGSNTSNLALGGIAGTVSFTSGRQVLKNLSLTGSASAALGTALDITDGASPGSEGAVSVTGTSVLNTAGYLTLKSGANGTARVAPGAAGGGYINGDVTVERYLSPIRAWRLLGAPAYGQTIKQAWQENQPAGVNPGTGYGTMITSSAGTWAANGFDFNTPGNSLVVYNPASNSWTGIANTTSPISAAGSNKSYMIFTRGDRSITPAMGTNVTPTPVLLRIKGSLFQGNLPAVAVASGQFAAVGNNYASPVDFSVLSKTNIDASFSVWDPKIPGAQGLGGWVTFSAANAWLPVPAGGSYPAGVPVTRIESGQAFMVHSTGGGGITFTENSKITGSKTVLRPAGFSARPAITTNLYNRSTGVDNITDANVVIFSDEYSAAIDRNDALKPNNFGDNFAVLSNGKTLVVETRPMVTADDTIFFNMRNLKLQPYRLEFVTGNFDNTLTGFLEDTYLRISTPVSMNGTTTVDFAVTSNAASAAANRFRIVFRDVRPLPVKFVTVTAIQKDNDNVIEWKVENEINIVKYEVERSADGVYFAAINSVAATENTGTYNSLDALPLPRNNFYRIKSIDKDGTAGYSSIVKIVAGKEKAGFAVYPNPVTDGNITLQLSNLPAGVYTARLFNLSGVLITKDVINHPGGTSVKVIRPKTLPASGTYQLEITGMDGKASVIKILVDNK